MNKIPVALMEFSEGGKVIWIHNRKGGTVLRIQCSGTINVHGTCENICAHADINVRGNIDICIPQKPARERDYVPMNIAR